jgi:hypothetical protein
MAAPQSGSSQQAHSSIGVPHLEHLVAAVACSLTREPTR